MDDLIKIKNLIKTYEDKIALNDINMTFKSGTVIGLLGPNGSGKTTLIKSIAGLIRPDRGEVLINDKKLSYKSKEDIAYLADGQFLFENFTIREAQDFYLDFYKDFDNDLSDRMVEYFALNPTDRIDKLSKGDKEKLHLSLILARNAKIFLMDEPLDGLDPISIAKIVDIIIDKINNDSLFIISTHQIGVLENIFDEVIFLNKGEIYHMASASDIRDENMMDIADYYNEIYLG